LDHGIVNLDSESIVVSSIIGGIQVGISLWLCSDDHDDGNGPDPNGCDQGQVDRRVPNGTSPAGEDWPGCVAIDESGTSPAASGPRSSLHAPAGRVKVLRRIYCGGCWHVRTAGS
jgi:hypothetical protein